MSFWQSESSWVVDLTWKHDLLAWVSTCHAHFECPVGLAILLGIEAGGEGRPGAGSLLALMPKVLYS